MEGRLMGVDASEGKFAVDPRKEALHMLEKGIQQVIELNFKAMLGRSVLLVGAKRAPVYTLIKCGESSYKYSVKFEALAGEELKGLSVEGMECKSENAAEVNAVICAFQCLKEICSISVCDFSSRVVVSLDGHNTASSASEAIGMVKKIMDNLDVALWKCRELGLELDRKVMRDPITDSVAGTADLYSEMSKYLVSMVKSFSVRSFAARDKMKKLEEGRIRCQGKTPLKRKEISEQGKSKTVLLPCKGLLDMVLAHLGLPKASYSSSVKSSGMVKSQVQFRLPYFDQLRVAGVINVKGKADRTTRAEEKAAFEAILFIEQNCRVKIVDVNHVERQEAEEQQLMLMDYLGQILEIGEEVKELWDGLIQAVNDKVEETNNGLENCSSGEENIAMKVCYDGLVDVVEVSDNCYSESWRLMCKLKKIKTALFGSKLKLGMITVPANFS